MTINNILNKSISKYPHEYIARPDNSLLQFIDGRPVTYCYNFLNGD